MLIHADARRIPLVDGCVHCVVTSPPYWGLRDYGTARWEGGDPACDHFKLAGGTGAQGLGKSAAASAANVERSSVAFKGACGKCGALRVDAQLGLEASPAAYVEALVAVFREVRRVLADDGVVWLNLGDSYAGGGYANHAINGPEWYAAANLDKRADRQQTLKKACAGDGIKPKDLVGIPWRVAFALQADGWYLRSDVIWHKPNPMPESVTDRPTKAHEYVFLLTKSERYYYDADAGREQHQAQSVARVARTHHKPGHKWEFGPGRHQIANDLTRALHVNGRNARSVWTITTKPYAGAHFATMPEALAERCIRAGSRPGDLVLDPFGGSGTTVRIARRLNRRGLALELNPKYLTLATARVSGVQLELFEVAG